MSFALAESPTSRKLMHGVFPWLGMGVCLAVLGTHLALDFMGRRRASDAVTATLAEAQEIPRAQASAQAGTSISLSESKLKAAKITIEAARYDQLPTELVVPGRIEVNADRRIEIRPRASGVIREVHVVLGQNVKRGERLVTLDSPDVGTARLNLRARQRELNTARIEGEWKSQIAATVELLIPEIRKGTDPSVIAKEFGDKPLGMYRGSLLYAYAEYDIAAHEEEKTAGLRSQEIIGEHPAVVARHTREGLQAKLHATIEQVKFDAAQEKRLADQRVKRAESEVIDAAQRLRILGVSENIRGLLDHADKADEIALDENVTIYQIHCPFDGTVIKKDAVLSQKADANDVLFTIADLNTVWVTASVAESDLAKVPSIQGGAIRLSATAYGNRSFLARLLSVGAMVDPLTRTVPLLAQSDNQDGLLKPGMFVRILLDSPTTERVLTVPHSAVVEIEGKNGVFVPVKTTDTLKSGHHMFSFRPFDVGRDAGDRVVVKAGLKEGDRVVAGGAYQLKSELILQNEPAEE
jgi:RND family efflux transporter MFP subunit